MNKIIEKNRIFQQDTPQGNRYLLFPREHVQKYMDVQFFVGIPKGEFHHPVKWTIFGYNADPFIIKDEFSYTDYEFLFYPDDINPKEIEAILGSYHPEVKPKEFHSMLCIQELHPAVIEGLRQLLLKEVIEETEIQEVDALSYMKDGKTHFFNLHPDGLNDVTTEEYTEQFAFLDSASTFVQETDGKREYLHKISSEYHIGKGLFQSEERWFYHYQAKDFPFEVLEELYGIEDFIRFTRFSAIHQEETIK